MRRTVTEGWFDIGAINSAIDNTLEYDENQVETANAGKLALQIRNMTISGSFTLINLDPQGVERLGGGLFERAEIPGGPVTPEDQVIEDAQLDVVYPIVMLDADGVNIKPVGAFTATITASIAGVLTKDDDFIIAGAPNSPSGFVLILLVGGTAGVTPGETITIDYDAVTPVETQIIYMGSSTEILSAYGMRVTHTDENGKIRQLEMFAVDPNSGGFAFNFKGANEDGVEEMPLAYTAKLDTSLTDGRQLAAWTIETGAL